MKWKDLCLAGSGAFILYFALYVFDGGRVLTRGGYSSMTRESHPLVFWFEVGTLTLIGDTLLAYGLAGLLRYSNVTSKLDTVADRFPMLKFQTFLICSLLVMLVAGLGWLVVDELMRTSRLKAGGK